MTAVFRRDWALKNQYIVALIVITVFLSSTLTWTLKPAETQEKPINVDADTVQFTAEEVQAFYSIRDRIAVYNTDPTFTGDRNLEWISMRNSTSAPWDPPQKSMEYLCFWTGRGANGEWEAVVSIYNAPNSTSDYVVEVSRFTWHSLEVRLDGKIMASFSQVTNDTVSLGYTSFHVKV
jgi:hypothetical protein